MDVTQQHIAKETTKQPFYTRCVHFCVKSIVCVGWVSVILTLFVLVIDGATGVYVKDSIYTDIEKLPKYNDAVVLGTSKYYSKGSPNLYYKYRLEAAMTLLKRGKVKNLLVSGDNKTPYYNEPKVMQNDLRRMGVQKELIKQDFAGYRTLDSIVRAREVYQLEPFVIVTQQFHCERALFIAKYHHIDAVCFAAKYPEGHIKVRIREFFARLGMLWDFLMDTQPETLERVASREIKS
ncbi:YdcF family protein [Actinobacillus equuli subsp. haemolyticus]|uniref:SanA/YdcF family protein n=1 Tax=Actinobacillus equuli TaxID=718 RepID=UPI00244293DE|nr:ElyC/SanA/YdcF family protein [Actinobacillus equuli]WGE70525.1 YdcF family protein [Actinobacillus equuli subsp. haemolyticus]WGE88393.1 YdcF family protein [Actinobacillus equuli subsp. haemolyticus]